MPSFAASRRFKVSLADGSKENIVTVEDRKPITRMLRRHKEEVTTKLDGTKKIEMVPCEVEHVYDMQSEMIADAVRAYNDATPDKAAKSIKQLLVVDLGPVQPESQVAPPVQRPSRKAETAAV